MKIMTAAPYIYDKNHREFCRTSSGFGYMVKDILDGISEENEVSLFTHQFSKGYFENFCVVKHSVFDFISNIKIRDIKASVDVLLKKGLTLNDRMHYIYYLLDRGAFEKTLKKKKPDVVHIHGLTYQTRPFIDACFSCNVPFVVTLHGINGLDDSVNIPQEEKHYERDELKKLALKKVPVTVVSSGIRNRIIEQYGLKENDIVVVLNGTHDPLVQNITKDKDRFVILCIGSICERKNQMQLVEVLGKLDKSLKDRLTVYFIGVNSENISIDERITELGLNYCCKYLGFLSREKMSYYWNIADLNIVMSKDEGFGLSIIEGFTYGVPTLTFDDLDAVDDLYNSKTMVLMKDRKDETVCDSIKYAVEYKWDKDIITAWSNNYLMNKISKQYIEIYKTVI